MGFIPVSRMRLQSAISSELERAYRKHGMRPWSRHEFYAILREEVDELWDAIKADEPPDRVLEELVHVAAMCFRFAETDELTFVAMLAKAGHATDAERRLLERGVNREPD